MRHSKLGFALITLAAAACACSRSNRKPDGPVVKVFGPEDAGQPPSPDAGAPTTAAGPAGIKGQLVYEGKTFSLERPLEITAHHCREAMQTSIGINISLPAADAPYKGLPLQLLAISGDPSKLKLGEKIETETADRTFEPGPDDRARVLAWISNAGRAGEASLPKRAWVRFDALSPTGAIDVSFDLDFGELGHAEGRVVLASSSETTCVIPAPPPPPPAG